MKREHNWRDVEPVELNGKYGFKASCWVNDEYVAFRVESQKIWPSPGQAMLWGEAECAKANAEGAFSNFSAVVASEPVRF